TYDNMAAEIIASGNCGSDNTTGLIYTSNSNNGQNSGSS
ncbi:unnamed protein product, partial [Rotaria sp. Silwood1]